MNVQVKRVYEPVARDEGTWSEFKKRYREELSTHEAEAMELRTELGWRLPSIANTPTLPYARRVRVMAEVRAGKWTTRRGFLAVMGGIGVTVGIGGLLRACGTINGSEEGPDLESFITPNEDFFLLGIKPHFEPELDITSVESAWSLSLTGFGGRQHELRYSDLRNLQAVNFPCTVECIHNPVGGPFISNAQWRGTPLRNVLEPVLPGDRSGYVVMFRALDGYYSSVSIERCLSNDSFLAYEMNGVPLPSEHGFPVRVVLPDLYGMKQPKWIHEIALVEGTETTGYFEEFGWASEVSIKTTTRIDPPPKQSVIDGEPATLHGIAFAGARGIKRVEISLDGGINWEDCELVEGGEPGVWGIWTYDWILPTAGEHLLMARSTDGAGTVQTSVAQSGWPDGASGYHSVSVPVDD